MLTPYNLFWVLGGKKLPRAWSRLLEDLPALQSLPSSFGCMFTASNCLDVQTPVRLSTCSISALSKLASPAYAWLPLRERYAAIRCHYLQRGAVRTGQPAASSIAAQWNTLKRAYHEKMRTYVTRQSLHCYPFRHQWYSS